MSHVNLRDPEAMRQALLPWLHARMPKATVITLPMPLKPEIGGSSETFLIDPIIREGATERHEHWVVRIEATGHQVYMDPSIERQFRVMEVLSETGQVPVPKTLWFEAKSEVLGAPFFLMEKIDGRALPTMHNSQGLLAESSASDRHAMWLSAIEMLAKVHSGTDPRLEFLGRPDLGKTGVDQELAYWHHYMLWTGASVRAEQDYAFTALNDTLPAERETGLAWGDARPGNMIFRNNAVQAVIDWETVSLGSAESDLGWWLFYDWNVSAGAGIQRLDGLGDREQTIAAWEHFAGRKAQEIDWHEAFATLRFSLIFDRAWLLAQQSGQTDDAWARGGQAIAQRLGRLTAN